MVKRYSCVNVVGAGELYLILLEEINLDGQTRAFICNWDELLARDDQEEYPIEVSDELIHMIGAGPRGSIDHERLGLRRSLYDMHELLRSYTDQLRTSPTIPE